MSEILDPLGELYVRNGQTEFQMLRAQGSSNNNACAPLGGKTSFFQSTVRYRWNGSGYDMEYVEPERLIYGTGK